MNNKTSVINDPLGQTHNFASSDHCFLLFCSTRLEKWGRTYGRTIYVKKQLLWVGRVDKMTLKHKVYIAKL